LQTLIAGGGTIGSKLAMYLTERGDDVTVIEEDRAKSEWLSKNSDAKVYNGNMLNPELLMEAGIDKADTLIVALGDDQLTRKVVDVAKSQFGVPRVIAIAKETEFCEQIRASGADQVICSEDEVVDKVESMLVPSNMKTIYKDGLGEFLITKVSVGGRSGALGKLVSKIEDKFAKVSGIARNHTLFFPTEETTIEMGDELFIIGRKKDLDKVVDIINQEG
jgi:trk system potassium uptake protein